MQRRLHIRFTPWAGRIAGALALGLVVAGCGAEGAPDPAGDQSAQPGDALRATASAGEQLRMKAYLDSLYDRAAVRSSFTQPSGAIVDCVDVAAQPGLRGAGAGLKGQPIATPPPSTTSPGGLGARLADLAGTEVYLQPGRRNSLGVEMVCPAGTIPVRRTTLDDAARFLSLDDMMRKHPADVGVARDSRLEHLARDPEPQPPRIGPTSLHQYAHAAQDGLANTGANVTINVWNMFVQAASEFSLGQLWVVGGSGSNLQTLEAGVQKYPNLYNNWVPNLFIYSTSNGYGNQGCYNLQCGRFVQVDNRIVIGGSISPVSTDGGTQYETQVAYYLYQGNWWLQVQGIWVGYYPGSLFNASGIANGATVIDFGGEIIDDRTQHSYHTLTDMGSGAFPPAWFTHAAYMRNIYYWIANGSAYWATGISPSRSDSYCYDVAKYDNDPNWHTYLFYGGPGYNTNCQ